MESLTYSLKLLLVGIPACFGAVWLVRFTQRKWGIPAPARFGEDWTQLFIERKIAASQRRELARLREEFAAGRAELRFSWWHRILMVFGTILCGAFAVIHAFVPVMDGTLGAKWSSDALGVTWIPDAFVAVCYACWFLLLVAAVYEAFIVRVTVTDSGLESRAPWRWGRPQAMRWEQIEQVTHHRHLDYLVLRLDNGAKMQVSSGPRGAPFLVSLLKQRLPPERIKNLPPKLTEHATSSN